MKSFSYSAPATLDEARALIGAAARPLAGGTDLLTLMKADLAVPERLVAIRSLLSSEIVLEENHLTVGAGATLRDIAAHDEVARRCAALAQAAAVAASPQLRNMATLGGNLLQRPRCWYFRSPHVRCWLKGGERCAARDGENRGHALFHPGPCVAVHPSDLAAALLAFDAQVRVLGAQGAREVSLADFMKAPEDGRRRETILRDDELLLGVRVPAPAEATRSIYLKAMDRQAFAFALAAVAAVLRISAEGKIEHARVVLGAVAPVPWRAHGAERVLLGSSPTQNVLDQAARAALAGATPLAHNGWKVPLARALVRRALQALA